MGRPLAAAPRLSGADPAAARELQSSLDMRRRWAESKDGSCSRLSWSWCSSCCLGAGRCGSNLAARSECSEYAGVSHADLNSKRQGVSTLHSCNRQLPS